MSAGHQHHGGTGQGSQVIDKLLANPEFVQHLLKTRSFCHDFDLPYLGGTSKDDCRVYLDRHLPASLSYEHNGNKVEFNPYFYIGCHERFERSTMDVMKWGYEHAHQAAEGYEHRMVLRAGLQWPEYNKCVNTYVKAAEHEKLKKVPADLDMRPYLIQPVNRALLAHMKAAMGGRELEKRAKDEVDYSEGMAKSHCGPVKKWPRGDCSFYEGDNSCEKVKGYISPNYWCKLWKRSTSQ